jgi:multidrug efflux pump subunit AcrA (membrane-fusion protein)
MLLELKRDLAITEVHSMQEAMQETSLAVDKKNRIVRNITIIFFSVVLLFTLFSRTINNLLLPEVICTFPSHGVIKKNISAIGEVKALSTQKIYAYGNWRVTDLKVKTGDYVAKGDILAIVDIGDQLLEEKRLEIDISKMEYELKKYQRKTDSIDITKYEKDEEQAFEKVKKAEENLDTIKRLYESGAESLSNYKKAQDDLKNAKREYSDQQKLLSDKRNESNVINSDDQEYINLRRLEIAQKRLELDSFRKKVPENGEIRSIFDGVVAAVGIDIGAYSSSGQLMMEVAEEEKGYHAEWKLNIEKAELLDVGSDAQFTVKSAGKTVYNTRIKSKQYNNEEECYLFVSESLKADRKLVHGQKVDVDAVKRSEEYPCIVPASSIVELNGESYIFVLEERNGILGTENYVKEVKVIPQDSNGLDTAISVTLDTNEKVVKYTTKALSDGLQVKLR